MDLHDQVPVLLGGVGEGLVAQDAGVADQDVDLAEIIQGGLEDVLAALDGRDVVGVGRGPAAGRDDVVDHLLRRAPVRARAVARSAQVVDDDRRAFLGEQLGVGLAQPVPCARNDGDFSVQQTHARSSSATFAHPTISARKRPVAAGHLPIAITTSLDTVLVRKHIGRKRQEPQGKVHLGATSGQSGGRRKIQPEWALRDVAAAKRHPSSSALGRPVCPHESQRRLARHMFELRL